MNNWHKFIGILMTACWLSQSAIAVELESSSPEDENTISLFGTGCENVKEGEAKSSIRVRASDKASFNAVEKIGELSDYRNTFSSHDFNVLVYSIVDNYVEDLTVRTTRQDDEQLCVEVTGYLDSENILKSLNDNFQKFAQSQAKSNQIESTSENYLGELEIEQPTNGDNSLAAALPPKPQPIINPQIAAEQASADDFEAPESPVAETPEIVEAPQPTPAPTIAAQPVVVDVEPAAPQNTTVYIEKTKYFNNTLTNRFYNDLANLVQARQGLQISRTPQRAGYTIKSNVLRAKVEQINQKTSRLQMVIAVELVNNVEKSSIVEHQNRFILFESTDDEQQIAADLMKKLLNKAASQVINRIKISDNTAIITPTGTNYGVFAPTPPLPLHP